MKAIAYAMSIVALLAGSGFAGDRMKEKLGLTDEQAKKMEAANKTRREALQPLKEQMKQSMDKLSDQVKNNAPEADIQATLDQIEKNRQALRSANEKLAAETKSILKPSQRAKMMLGMREMGKDRKGIKEMRERRRAERKGDKDHDHGDHGDHEEKE